MATITLNPPFQPLVHLYGAGVVHLAWIDIDESNESHLLFGIVELLPKEIPAPPLEKPTQCQLAGAVVHLERTVCDARVALLWYEQSRAGACPALGRRAKVVRLQSPLCEEPPWPELGPRGEATPFLSSFAYDSRICHVLSLNDSNSFPWPSNTTKRDATTLVSKWFHFNVERYDEYLGSLTLVAHNPILRRLREVPRETAGGKHSVLVRLERRHHAEPSPVTLAITEERPTIRTGQVAEVTLDEVHEILLEREEGALGISAYHSSWGVLYQAPARHFLKSVGLSIYVPPEPRVVSGARGQYEVTQRAEKRPAPIKLHHATHKLNLASSWRKSKNSPAQPSQRLDYRSREAAQDYVRRLIHSADRILYIIDPYFRASDIEFLLATGTAHVEVRLLGSSLGFKDRASNDSEESDPPSGIAELRRENAKRVHSHLQQLAKSGYRNPVEFRVMPGRKAPYFHDRFIVADDAKAWSLGGSLSDLGDRLSMVLELPNPAPLLEHASKCWDNATPLSSWVLANADGEPKA